MCSEFEVNFLVLGSLIFVDVLSVWEMEQNIQQKYFLFNENSKLLGELQEIGNATAAGNAMVSW